MELTKQDLFDVFSKARETESDCVFVSVIAEGVEEVIVIPKRSFDAKESFYNKAYNDNLTHVMNSDVCITGLYYGQKAKLDEVLSTQY